MSVPSPEAPDPLQPETVRLHRADAPAAVPTAPQSLPTAFGEFRLIEVLGRGADSVVYRAEQVNPPCQVALKVLSPSYGARFALEAEALARLDHPGVAKIHHCGTVRTSGLVVPYIAMELVDGLPLNRFAAERRLSLRARVELMTQVADAVEYAHRHGVIHRDLKPANVLVSGVEPRARVLDFGLARVIESVAAPGHHTAAGTILGTPGYMSPEQAAGNPDIDTRADVHALGAMLYELIAGCRPIATNDQLDLATMLRIQSEVPPPLAQLGVAAPEDVSMIVAKALAKDREHRYASAGEFAAELRRFLRGDTVHAGAGRRRYVWSRFVRRNRVAVAAGLVVAIGCAVAVFGVSYGLWRARRAARAAIEVAAAMVDRGDGFDLLAGSRQACIRCLEEQMPRYERLAADCPEEALAVRMLADAKRQLANLRRDGGQWAESLDLRLVGLTLRERLVELRPDDPEAELELALERVLYADALKELHGYRRAAPVYAQAHSVFERLGARFPQSRRYVDEHGWSIDRMAQVALDDGAMDHAALWIEQRRRNVAGLKRLANAHPSTRSAETALLHFEAELLRARGEVAGALEQHRGAYAVAVETAREHPDRFDAQRYVLSAAALLAAAQVQIGDHLGADEVLRDARERARRLIACDAHDERTLTWAATLSAQHVDLLLGWQLIADAQLAASQMTDWARELVGADLQPGWRANLYLRALGCLVAVAHQAGDAVEEAALRRQARNARLVIALHRAPTTAAHAAVFREVRAAGEALPAPLLWRIVQLLAHEPAASWADCCDAAEAAQEQTEFEAALALVDRALAAEPPAEGRRVCASLRAALAAQLTAPITSPPMVSRSGLAGAGR